MRELVLWPTVVPFWCRKQVISPRSATSPQQVKGQLKNNYFISFSRIVLHLLDIPYIHLLYVCVCIHTYSKYIHIYSLYIYMFNIYIHTHLLFMNGPWPVWLSWLGVIPQSERSPVGFLIRAHAWVAGLVPGQGEYRRQLYGKDQCFPLAAIFLSISSSLPLSQNK